MQIISPAALLIEQVVGKQRCTDNQAFRLMSYVIQCPVDDGVLFYNTLTCCLLWLSKEETAHLEAQQELIDRWFLVPVEFDEQKFCQQIRSLARHFQSPSKNIKTYTILTTTGCNAHCFYCYEKGTTPIPMTTELALKLSKYIIAHRGEEEVKIRWFGGEPLMNIPVVDQICSDLSENDVPFHSMMITNGFLFDAEIIQRARTLWHLRDVQITLDGKEKTYNKVKRYDSKTVNAFERVIKNIELLATGGINVIIRLNVDIYNIEEMSQLVSFLHARFGSNNYITIYSRELYGRRKPEDSFILYNHRMKLEQQIAAYGYSRKHELQKSIKLGLCVADNDQSVLVSPDGYLGKCDYYIDQDFFGHIDSDDWDEDKIISFKKRPAVIDACATCSYYPQCFRLIKCENGGVCTPEIQKENIYNTIQAMKGEYQNYIKKNNHETQI